MARLLRAVFPRNGVMLHVRYNDGAYEALDRSPVQIHGFTLSFFDHILRIVSPIHFDEDFSGFIRIPLISGDVDIRFRSILGYVVVGTDGSIRFWNKSMCFRDDVLPFIYRTDTRFSLMVTFELAFSTVFCVWRLGHVVNVQEVKFFLGGILIDCNIVTGNNSVLMPYQIYQNLQDPVVRSIRARFSEMLIPAIRDADLNAIWLEGDRDLMLAFFYYEWLSGNSPPYFGGIYNLIKSHLAPPAFVLALGSVDSIISSIQSDGKFFLFSPAV